MNLIQFLDQIDLSLSEIPTTDIRDFVHELARIIPQNQRETAIKRLSTLHDAKEKSDDEIKQLEQIAQKLLVKIKQIEAEELYVQYVTNYEYDDWYFDSGDEFIYDDPTGLLDTLQNIFDFISSCMDEREYNLAYVLSNKLASLKIFLKGDDELAEDAYLSLHDLHDEWPEEINYKQYAICHAYLLFIRTEKNNRAKVLYDWLFKTNYVDYDLESVFLFANEIEGLQTFLPTWLDFLGRLNSRLSSELLFEALDLSDDDSLRLEIAKKYVEHHPELYYQYFEDHLEDSFISHVSMQQLYKSGEQGILAIEPKYKVRSRLAQRMCILAEKLNDQEKIDQCRWWIFESDSTVQHFLKWITESKNPDIEEKINQTKQLIVKLRNLPPKEHIIGEYYLISEGLRENRPSESRVRVLQFFCWNNEALPTSSLSPSQIFFMIMCTNQEKLSSEAMYLLNRALSAIEEDHDVDEETFTAYGLLLKKYSELIQMTEQENGEALKNITRLVSQLVRQTIDRKDRKSYELCAAYIAMLAESKVSLQISPNKQEVLKKYYQKYRRYPAFVRNLEKYGLKR